MMPRPNIYSLEANASFPSLSLIQAIDIFSTLTDSENA
jgi:hypothetical protein